jgi:phosphopantothenoylcysteine decarboxylase/phosphopantothenate--cysteine ligase
MAHGACDNFLLAVYMSARCPVMVAPAMDEDMWLHSATTENIEKLVSFGHKIIQPGTGALASGLSGKGRMAEPEEIYAGVVSVFNPEQPLKGKKALVTAGPTYEKLDPVRFIGNFSTGKMGFAIAAELSRLGATVNLVYGPGVLNIDDPSIRITRVVTGAEMAQESLRHFEEADITVLAAAVSDFRPVQYAMEKIKKQDVNFQLNLEKTTDIALELGKLKKPGQVIVGFALETENEIENAKTKLVNKKFDMLVLNSLRDEGAGFGADTNKITLIWPGNKTQEFGLKTKVKAATDIVNHIVQIVRK